MRGIPPIYHDLLAELARRGWLPHISSFVQRDHRGNEVLDKVGELNEAMLHRYGNDPLVARALPIRVTLVHERTDYKLGKAAKHGAVALECQVEEGVHIDDRPDICDSFATRWKSEARVFRVQYHHPRPNDDCTHRNPGTCFRSGEDAVKCILTYNNVAALCGRR